jgi:GTP pyrophosphokinase
MGRLKRDLEDLAFPYVEPEAYGRMQSLLSEKRSQADEYVQKLLKSLKKELASQGFRQFRTDYRVKGLYSLYTKLQRKSWDMEKIHDLYAIRIIVPSVSDCYTVLGIVHNAWRPLPGKIKDYIAFRKPNGYRSLHTTIFSGDGGTVEIQIRTEEMHREAQYGIASHFAYKEEQEGRRTGIRNNLQWFRQLLAGQRRNQQPSDEQTDAAHSADLRATPSWIQELAETQNGELESATSPRQFLNTIKADFFCHRIFVFTPDDDAVDLPIHSTPIDFAYAIHSDIGNHAVGAQVNGKQAALSRKLENGDIVKIETSKHAHPTSKWLNIAKTALARKHIRASLSRAGTDERSHIGKAASGKWK